MWTVLQHPTTSFRNMRRADTAVFTPEPSAVDLFGAASPHRAHRLLLPPPPPLYAACESLFKDTATPEAVTALLEQFVQVRPVLETGWEAVLMVHLLHAGTSVEELLTTFQSDMKVSSAVPSFLGLLLCWVPRCRGHHLGFRLASCRLFQREHRRQLPTPGAQTINKCLLNGSH